MINNIFNSLTTNLLIKRKHLDFFHSASRKVADLSISLELMKKLQNSGITTLAQLEELSALDLQITYGIKSRQINSIIQALKIKESNLTEKDKLEGHQPHTQDLDDLLVQSSPKTRLKQSGITNTKQLVNMTEANLKSKGIGKKIVEEIKAALEKIDCLLKEDIEEK